MQLPHDVPAPASVATLALNQVLHALLLPLSPQAVMNAVMSPAAHTPWLATAGAYVGGVKPDVLVGGHASEASPPSSPLLEPPLLEPDEDPLLLPLLLPDPELLPEASGFDELLLEDPQASVKAAARDAAIRPNDWLGDI